MAAAAVQSKNLPRIGLYFGIIGTIALLFFSLIFLEDLKNRYAFMCFLIPIPIILLSITRKFQFIGGLLLVVLGITVFIFDIYNSPVNTGQIAGGGLGFTIGFVSLPFIISGILFIVT
jgi:hypothetical protein